MTSHLADFLSLKDSGHSVSREALLRHRVLFDLGVAAAAQGYALRVYASEVDRDGHDLVVEDDEGWARRIQLKSIVAHGRAKGWSIRAPLLRHGLHADGCVVLQVVRAVDDQVEVSYEFTDRFVLRAFQLGILSRKQWAGAPSYVGDVALAIDEGDRPVWVRRSLFVPVKNASALFRLLGLKTLDAAGSSLSACLGSERRPPNRATARELLGAAIRPDSGVSVSER